GVQDEVEEDLSQERSTPLDRRQSAGEVEVEADPGELRTGGDELGGLTDDGRDIHRLRRSRGGVGMRQDPAHDPPGPPPAPLPPIQAAPRPGGIPAHQRPPPPPPGVPPPPHP